MKVESHLPQISATLNPLSQLFLLLWGFMLPLVIFVHTMISSILTVAVSFSPSRQAVDWCIGEYWAKTVLKLCNIDVEIRGAEKVPKGVGFLYIFNHVSFFDIFVMFAFLPRMFRFGAKIELFKIPFFGSAMKRVGILPIDRKSPATVYKIYEEAQARVQKGECFALAPEGTRQKSLELGAFRKGPFIFALHSKMNLVPVVMSGALDFMSSKYPFINANPWSKRTILLTILDPIDTSNFDKADPIALMDYAHKKIKPVHDQSANETSLLPQQRLL